MQQKHASTGWLPCKSCPPKHPILICGQYAKRDLAGRAQFYTLVSAEESALLADFARSPVHFAMEQIISGLCCSFTVIILQHAPRESLGRHSFNDLAALL
jgi:hypothetical protein